MLGWETAGSGAWQPAFSTLSPARAKCLLGSDEQRHCQNGKRDKAGDKRIGFGQRKRDRTPDPEALVIDRFLAEQAARQTKCPSGKPRSAVGPALTIGRRHGI